MRLLVVFVFAVFCLIGHVVTHKTAVSTLCTSDDECGAFCFCLKQEHHYQGECECNMDPYYLIICHDDIDCVDHTRGVCQCVKEGYSTSGGCSCTKYH